MTQDSTAEQGSAGLDRMSAEDFDRFDRRCKDLGVGWFATVQDLPSLEFMLSYDLPLYKVASSNARNNDLLAEVARQVPRDRAIVISVGGSTLTEVERTSLTGRRSTQTLGASDETSPWPG